MYVSIMYMYIKTVKSQHSVQLSSYIKKLFNQFMSKFINKNKLIFSLIFINLNIFNFDRSY